MEKQLSTVPARSALRMLIATFYFWFPYAEAPALYINGSLYHVWIFSGVRLCKHLISPIANRLISSPKSCSSIRLALSTADSHGWITLKELAPSRRSFILRWRLDWQFRHWYF